MSERPTFIEIHELLFPEGPVVMLQIPAAPKGIPIRTRGLKDDYFKKLILEYLDKYKQASREDIDKLLLDILPGVLAENQRKNKIRNLVHAISKKDKTIINQGSNRYPKWVRAR